ncbi:MAG TPA: VOC family protein [Caulobacteraceae bacterium]|nr:VOC family protein [Caulobacteraceae bacterium]
MAGARFSQINVVVRDMEASVAFYRRLGIDIPEGAVWTTGSGGHHVKAGEGEMDVEFDSHRMARAYNSGFAAERGRVVIGVDVESREAVDALWEALLAESVQGLQPPFDAFWGARYAIVEDPDGNPVGIMSPVDPARRSAPPEL